MRADTRFKCVTFLLGGLIKMRLWHTPVACESSRDMGSLHYSPKSDTPVQDFMAENSPPHLDKERKGRNSPATKPYVMQVLFFEILLNVHLPLGIVVTIWQNRDAN